MSTYMYIYIYIYKWNEIGLLYFPQTPNYKKKRNISCILSLQNVICLNLYQVWLEVILSDIFFDQL